jgi:Fe-S-cluster containining protein
MTAAPAFAFTCAKCGQCCKRGGPEPRDNGAVAL